MTAALLTLALPACLLWPLLLALRASLRGQLADRGETPRALDPLWCTAPLPALALAAGLWGSGHVWHFDAWMLGGVWALDATRGPVLLFSALLWTLAGVHALGYHAAEERRAASGDRVAASRLTRLALLWPLTLAGNLLLIVAEDIASFYLGFALMTFAAYGLVVHAGSRDARRGGLAYLVMAVLGEGMILGGLLWGAGSAVTLTLTGVREGLTEAPQAGAIALLLWLGFGVKAGVLGLHLWLPLAHPVAPTPASAVLSGAMIKAGWLGWTQTLPLGDPDMPAALGRVGWAMLVLGLAGAMAAALYGVLQRHPKAVLAYSSVSQMGMIAALTAMGLVAPELWPGLSAAVVLFVVHHGLTKGALFLGVGVSEHPPRLPGSLLWCLLALPALSLAGGLGSGLATKWAFKSELYAGGQSTLVTWLGLAAVGTSLLMARTLWCQWSGSRRIEGDARGPLIAPMPLAWLACLVLAVALPWWLGPALGAAALPPLAELPGLWWPLGLGIAMAAVVLVWSLRSDRRVRWSLPPGDLWWPLLRGWRRGAARTKDALGRLGAAHARLVEGLVDGERRLVRHLARAVDADAWWRRHSALMMLVVGVLLAVLLLVAP